MLFFFLFPSLSIFPLPTVFPDSSYFPSTKCLFSVIWLSLRPQFSHTFLIFFKFYLASLYCKMPARIPLQIAGQGSQLPLQPNGEPEGSKGEIMAGMGETEKQRNVEGKMTFLLADVARKLSLAYLVSLHLQEIFHIYKQGWNGQGKGSDATEQKTHIWCNMWHVPLCLTRSSHKRKCFSPSWHRGCPSVSDKWHERVLRSRRDKSSWFGWCLLSLARYVFFSPLVWPRWQEGCQSSLTETATGLSDTVPHISRFRHHIQHHLR